jgi:hypothetical protein
MQFNGRVFRVLMPVAAVIIPSASAWAGGHTWRVNEVFSNADGTIQFIEVKEFFGGNGETATAGHNVTSNTRSFTITANVSPPTGFRHILLATPAFAALPGAPTPDYVFPAGSVPFFSTSGDTVRYVPYCAYTFGAGVVPTDGVNSLTLTSHETHAFSIGPNSPTNYAGDTGSINVGCSDNDGDGYGDPGSPACTGGPQTDCDDSNPAVHPGATENCFDEIDNDCDGLADCRDPYCGVSVCPAVSAPVMALMLLSMGGCGALALRKRRNPAT